MKIIKILAHSAAGQQDNSLSLASFSTRPLARSVGFIPLVDLTKFRRAENVLTESVRRFLPPVHHQHAAVIVIIDKLVKFLACAGYVRTKRVRLVRVTSVITDD